MEATTNMWKESLGHVCFLYLLATRQRPAVPHKISSVTTFYNIAFECRSYGINIFF
jgi:hypothetical protein